MIIASIGRRNFAFTRQTEYKKVFMTGGTLTIYRHCTVVEVGIMRKEIYSKINKILVSSKH